MDVEHLLPFDSFDDVDANGVDYSRPSLNEAPYGDMGGLGESDPLHHHPFTGIGAEDGQNVQHQDDPMDLNFGSGGIQVNAHHEPVISALLPAEALPAILERLGDLASDIKIPVADSAGVTLEPLDDYLWQGGKG
jgi:hypothetical protein